jgi:quercetin dioxygenase-like cupin family protein
VKPLSALLVLTLPVLAQESSNSAVFDWSKLAVAKTATGERRAIVDRATPTMTRFESHVTTLEAGLAPHAPHRHPDEEIVIVKDGTLEVTINGKSQRVGEGSMFLFASNDLHGMKNVGSGRATYYVIRVVTPATPAAKKK